VLLLLLRCVVKQYKFKVHTTCTRHISQPTLPTNATSNKQRPRALLQEDCSTPHTKMLHGLPQHNAAGGLLLVSSCHTGATSLWRSCCSAAQNSMHAAACLTTTVEAAACLTTTVEAAACLTTTVEAAAHNINSTHVVMHSTTTSAAAHH
jgi:hypothetical protein